MARSFLAASSQDITFPNDVRLDLTNTDDFAVSFFYRFNGTLPPNLCCFLGRRAGQTGVGWEVRYNQGVQVGAGINTSTTPSRSISADFPNLFDGNWHHFLFEVDRDTAMRLYGDGNLLAQDLNPNGGSLNNGLPLTIGSANSQKYCSGEYAEFSFFKRLLATDERLALVKRFSAEYFRPWLHARITGNSSPERETRQGLIGTLSVSPPTKAVHPRIFRIESQQTFSQEQKEHLAGYIDGTSSLSSYLSAQVPVAGYVAGQSDLFAKLVRIRSLLGSIDAWSDLTAWLISDVPLQGNLPATSALPGNLTFLWRLWGEIHGQSNLPGFLRASVPIRGALTAQGDLDGWLMAVLDLGGQLNGDSTLLGKLRAAVPIAGSLDAVGDLDATLTRIRQVSALLAGNSVLSARLVRRTAFRGIIDGWGDLTGIPRVAYATKGSLDGDSDLTGKTSSLLAVRGVLPGTSDLAGKLAIQILMAGSLASTSDLQAYIRRRFRVSGEILANSDLMGRLEAWAWLQGIIEGDSSIEGMLTRLAGLAGEIEAESELTGRLRIPGQSEQTSVGGKAYTTGVGGYIARWYRGLP
jgi:hypothetical protein